MTDNELTQLIFSIKQNITKVNRLLQELREMGFGNEEIKKD